MADVEMKTEVESQNGAVVPEIEVKEEQPSMVENKPEPMDDQNGDAAGSGDTGDAVEANEHAEGSIFKYCVSKKISDAIAQEVVSLIAELGLSDEEFDERIVDQLSTFAPDAIRFILKALKESQLYGVSNRTQYIMSIMRSLKDRQKQLSAATALTLPLIPGPNADSIRAIVERTGYHIEVTVGQRKYHAPESVAAPNPSSTGHEIYIGQIPRDVFEDELIPLFETTGPIYDLRLMMDPINGRNRGYAFLLYTHRDHAAEAAKKYDGHEIQPGKQLKVNVSVANRRLFIGNIPKSKSKEEILEDLKNASELEGVVDVIIYSSPDAAENRRNRGFCFVDFQDHKAASDAKRRLQSGKVRPWNGDLMVDWAEQQEEPDEATMSQVKVLYVKNLKETVTEDKLKEIFGPFGEIDRVKKIRDYAFIHYKERESALKAIEEMKGTKIEDIDVDISLAKPQTDNKLKKKPFIPQMNRSSGSSGSRGPTQNFRGNGAPRGNRGGSYNGGMVSGPPSYNKGYYGGGQMGSSMPSSYGGGYDPYQSYPPQPYGYPPYDPYAAYPPEPYGYGQNGYAQPAPYNAYTSGARGGFMGRGMKRGAGGRGSKRRGESGGGPMPKRGGRPAN